MVSNEWYEAIRTGNDEIAGIGFIAVVRRSPARPGRGQVSQSPQSSGEPATRAKARVRYLTSQLPSDRVPRVGSTTGPSSGSTTGTRLIEDRPRQPRVSPTDRSRSSHSNRAAQRRGGATICRAGLAEPMRRPTIDWCHCASNAVVCDGIVVSWCQCSQLPRAGVSADAFVRPGVSAAQLAALQPGARSSSVWAAARFHSVSGCRNTLEACAASG